MYSQYICFIVDDLRTSRRSSLELADIQNPKNAGAAPSSLEAAPRETISQECPQEKTRRLWVGVLENRSKIASHLTNDMSRALVGV